jgi:hypothetical protein
LGSISRHTHKQNLGGGKEKRRKKEEKKGKELAGVNFRRNGRSKA